MSARSTQDIIPASIEQSDNCRNWFTAAKDCAAQRRHPLVGTEHFLWALFNSPATRNSIAKQYLERFDVTQRRVNAILNSLDHFKSGGSSAKRAIRLSISPRMQRAIQVAIVIGQNFYIATEYVVLGMMLDGSCIAADVIQHLSSGRVSPMRMLEALQMDAIAFMTDFRENIRPGTFQFTTTTIDVPRADRNDRPDDADAKEQSTLPELPPSDNCSQMVGPTNGSNWLIPGRVLIGACPYEEEVRVLLTSGVNTFLCLLEDSPDDVYGEYVLDAIADDSISSRVTSNEIRLVHFPIDDFDIADHANVIDFVQEVSRWIREESSLVYLHCLGGHGRTGTIAIQLLMQLYRLSAEDAAVLVNAYHDHRPRCAKWARYCELPETRGQSRQTRQNEWHLSRRSGKH